MARSQLQRIKNDLIFGALRAFAAVGARLSLPASRRVGRALGTVANAMLAREKKKANESLSIAFPELNSSDRAKLIRNMFRHLGQSLLEITWMRNLNASNLAATTSFEGLEHMKAAVAHERGVVLFTGHCGNWEWMAASIGLAGFDMNVVAREIYDPRINEFVVRSRARHGIRSIGRGSGSSARELLQTLRSGAILGVLIDQHIDAENADIEFFGKAAPTPVGPARLAIRTGAVAISGFIERRDGHQWIRFDPPVVTTREDDPVALTAAMTRAIEAQIRRVPEQWVWMHRRWGKRKSKQS